METEDKLRQDNSIEEKTEEEFESPLGRKDYWDEFYSQEIDQFKNNTDLIGEVWFGENVQNKIVKYIEALSESGKIKSKEGLKILDVGCGNAAFLLEVFEYGYRNLHGMDYSEKSIELASKICTDKSKDEGCSELANAFLYQEDINNPNPDHKDFDLIHDKGTFDAFMLLKGNSEKKYIEYIESKSIQSSSAKTLFIITSCNHSKTELLNFFKDSKFTSIGDIPHKTFSFGGQQGQTVTTLIFEINQ